MISIDDTASVIGAHHDSSTICSAKSLTTTMQPVQNEASIGGIAGGFVAVLVVMIVIAFGVIMVVRYQLKARQQQSGMQDRGARFENNAYEGGRERGKGREKGSRNILKRVNIVIH